MRAYANPHAFTRLARRLEPFFWAGALIVMPYALWLGVFAGPPDYQQGDSVRIMYLHVPAAWMATGVYTAMFVASAIALIWKHPVADVAAKAAAPVGAAFTLICLITGALWGRPMWGTYWVWDARLTAMLVLLFLYLGYMAVHRAMDDPIKAARAAAILCIVGVVNIPIIRFSVDWWETLHQPAAVIRFEEGALKPSLDPSMLTPLLLSGLGFALLTTALVLLRMRTEIAARRVRSLTLLAARA